MNQFAKLVGLPGFSFPVYASVGAEERAREIAARCQNAHRFLSQTLASKARIQVLVVTPEDWAQYSAYPVYGMPHYVDQQTLIVAGENNGFWHSMTPPVEALPLPAARAARTVYGLPDGTVDFSPFFDLLAIHEMTHLFHVQGAVQFPRLWLMEFFCNLALHSFVATEIADQLPALETLPQLIVGGGYERFPHYTLADFEQHYVNVGAQNYGWYQCQLHVAAKQVYEAGGIETLQGLWHLAASSDRSLSDQQLASRLRSEVHPRMERVLTEWPLQEEMTIN